MSLPDFTSTSRAQPWHHAGHRILRPFTVEMPAKNERYCHACTQWVAYGRDSAFESVVYAHKEWCLRCGTVLQHGVYNQDRDPAVGARAIAWALRREEITR